MQVHVHGQGVALTDRRRRGIAERADRMLHTVTGQIQRLEIVVRDENGPKGGSDKRCHIEAVIRRVGTINVTEQAGRTTLAIRQALRRLSRAIGDRLDKRRTLRRGRHVTESTRESRNPLTDWLGRRQTPAEA